MRLIKVTTENGPVFINEDAIERLIPTGDTTAIVLKGGERIISVLHPVEDITRAFSTFYV
jgi:uncharacterized protein YlzI (FlbEa/FlbD family)